MSAAANNVYCYQLARSSQERYLTASLKSNNNADFHYAAYGLLTIISSVALSIFKEHERNHNYTLHPFITIAALTLLIPIAIYILMPPYLDRIRAASLCETLKHIQTFEEFHQAFPTSYLARSNTFAFLFDSGIIDRKHYAPLSQMSLDYANILTTHPLPWPHIPANLQTHPRILQDRTTALAQRQPLLDALEDRFAALFPLILRELPNPLSEIKSPPH